MKKYYLLNRFIISVLFKVLLLFSIPLHSFSQPIIPFENPDSLLNELYSAKTDTNKLIILSKLYSLDTGNGEKSRKYAQEMVKVAEKIKSNFWISQAYYILGTWYRNYAAPTDSTIIVFHNLYKRMQQNKFIEGMAIACRGLAIAYTFEAVDSAVYYFIKSMDLSKSIKDTNSYYIAKFNLATAFYHAGKTQKAISTLFEVAEYRKKTGDKARLYAVYLNISECYMGLKDFHNAEYYFKKMTEYDTYKGANKVSISLKLAELYILNKKYDEAKKIYISIIDTSKKESGNLHEAYNGLATIAFENKNWAEAIKYKKLYWKYFNGDLNSESRVYEVLYKSYYALGRHKEAFENYHKYILLRDSFASKERLEKADKMEAHFQNKEKLSQITLLDREKRLQESETERQKILKNFMLLIFILVITISAFGFNRYKLKKNIEKQQAINNERQRISADLHDDIGSGLSKISLLSELIKRESQEIKVLSGNEKIANTLKEMAGNLNEIIWTLNSKNDYLENLIAYMRRYVAEYFENSTIAVKINTPAQIPNIPVTIEQRRNIFYSVKEALHNIVKHSNATETAVNFIINDNRLVVTIHDNGKGVGNTETELNRFGNGIKNMNSRMQSINGKFTLENQNGTKAVFEFPV